MLMVLLWDDECVKTCVSPEPERCASSLSETFDITTSLQRVRPWQEHQHLSSPLEGVGIFVFVKMVGKKNFASQRKTFPTDLRCNLEATALQQLKLDTMVHV